MDVGARAFARTPFGRSSAAMARISATTPVFATAYADILATATPGSAACEAKKTSEPRPTRRSGRKARAVRYAVVRLMLNWRFQTSWVLSATGPLRANPPAIWTSAFNEGPCEVRTVSANAATAEGSLKSQAYPDA